jgi:hypothetical protein
MNKRQILASLNNIANSLDNSGLCKEATSITNLMKRLAKEKYEFFMIQKIQGKYKILVRNAGQDFIPQPGTFESEKEAIEKAKSIADKDLTDRKPITDKDREDSLPAREKIRQLLKNEKTSSFSKANSMIKLAQEDKMKTKYSDDELNEAMTEQGIQTAFEAYKSKGGSASQDSFASQWKPLIGRMLEGFTNNMGVSIAEEKYKRNNPFWDPRD